MSHQEGNTITLHESDIKELARQVYELVKNEKETTVLESAELSFEQYFVELNIEVNVSNYDFEAESQDLPSYESWDAEIFLYDVVVWDIDGKEFELPAEQIEKIKNLSL